MQTALDLEAGTTSYFYDANGNLTTIYPPGSDAQYPVGALQYAYDQRNMMASHSTNPDGAGWVLQVEYVYDGANERLQQVDHTDATPITTTYTNDVFGLTQVLLAEDGANRVTNLFGLDLISQDSGSETRTLLADGLGSVRVEMVGGSVETVTTYSPYGKLLEQKGVSGTTYGFTGEQHDNATGLLYLRARYYNPYIYQRFLTPDPIVPDFTNPQNLNLYTYVLNNPVKYTDPTGHHLCEDLECTSPSQRSTRWRNSIIQQGANAIVSSLSAPVGVVPAEWRSVLIRNYQSLFGKAASGRAPISPVYIYYGLSVDNIEGLLTFEIVARVLVAENIRGLLPRDPRFANEVKEHWPQDQIAPAFIIYRNAARSGQTVAQHVGPNRTANPALHPTIGEASDNAHIVALGVDRGWLKDPSFGADWYFHKEKNQSYDYRLYLDDTCVGDYAAGTYWQPGYGKSRIIYPFGYRGFHNSPYP